MGGMGTVVLVWGRGGGNFMAHSLRFFPPPVTVQNTICSNTRSCSPGDGHNDARNMLR